MLRKIRSGLSLFKQALVGSATINYTEGSIARATFLLSVPMILEMAMESVFAIVDIFFVAGLGAEAVATVGLTEAVISLLYAIAIGLSMAATALVARRIGENNPQAAAVVAGQALWVGVAVSVLVGTVGFFYAGKILSLMGADAAVLATGETYTRIMFSGSFTIVFLFLNNAIFRGAGDASIAMRALILANGINIVLDPVLIYGWGPFPEMGLTGAAVATNIGRGIGVAYQLYYLCSHNRRIRLALSDLVMRLTIVAQLLRISVGGIAQFLIATASWVFLMRLVSNFGNEAVAGYTIAIRVIIFVILPSWGLSNAVATLVGQNLGAAKPERAERTVWQVVRYNVSYMLLVALVLIFFPIWVMGFFSENPDVVANGIQSLRILSYGFVFLALGSVVTQAFNGAGDTMTPTWINAFSFWLVQIPLAWTLAMAAGWGAEGVYWSIFIGDLTMGIIGTYLFMRGGWKRRSL
ncbi:MATE family efflux transporter [Pseudohongiella acticola]|jgi:putative MATE family efflux protein|uniref:Multidrug-efflux transporter n=1 Tax=Pseudohongiella acticola TaxID=1524254 RepID=A0A1E8CI55_9GAMM|nr:MATE family efflux transporter [Pseudohongiella acticola]OFE12078.1 MATE family efflux transporter [Pseudohongiella acticola]